MNKQQLILALKEKSDLTGVDATEVVQAFFNSIADALKRENRVEIRGLFSFYIKNYKGYIGQNPKTGKDVLVKPKKLPVFKCGKDLKELINY